MAAWRESRAAIRVRDLAASLDLPQIDPDLESRVADRVRTAEVAELFRAAADRSGRTDGEPSRSRFRAVASEYLDRPGGDASAEIAERRVRADPPDGGFEVAVIQARAPERRARLYEEWSELERSIDDAEQDRSRNRDDAARDAGAAGAFSFLAAAEVGDLDDLLERFRRIAIEPLDSRVRTAVGRRFREARLPALTANSAADWVALAALADHGEQIPRPAIRRALHEVRSIPGAEADESGPRLVQDDQTPWPDSLGTIPRPAVALGAIEGPLALALSLGAFGQAIRLGFLRAHRGPVAHFVDPAFAVACGVLFRRLVLSRTFPNEIGIRIDPAALSALRLEEAVAPRLAWAYLQVAYDRSDHAGSAPDRRRIEETVERATQRPVSPAEVATARACTPAGSAVLRGTVLGILTEEHLQTRFGREWYLERRAVSCLREGWEAEPENTAESMAAAQGIGTIEPTPILDGCRPE
jgi:hypothetical protein